MGQLTDVHHLSLAHIGCKSVYMIQTATKSLTLSKHVTLLNGRPFDCHVFSDLFAILAFFVLW